MKYGKYTRSWRFSLENIYVCMNRVHTFRSPVSSAYKCRPLPFPITVRAADSQIDTCEWKEICVNVWNAEVDEKSLLFSRCCCCCWLFDGNRKNDLPFTIDDHFIRHYEWVTASVVKTNFFRRIISVVSQGYSILFFVEVVTCRLYIFHLSTLFPL